MRRSHLIVAALVALTGVLAVGRAEEASDDRSNQRLFFANLRKLCGAQLDGATEFPQDPKHDFAGKKLVMSVQTCSESEIRIPFRVGEDTSRTWIISLNEKGLLLKHDHRHADGTPDKVTMYGGWAAPGGTARQQRFAADEETAKLIPEASTNVWTLAIGEGGNGFTYALERHRQLRYKATLKRAAD